MNEFKEMIKEAFLGEEPYDPSSGQEDLQAAIRSYESRDRTLRLMMWFAATFMSVVAAWAAWSFFATGPETSTKKLILYATAFLFASQGVGWAKMFLFSAQKDLSVLKELKRIQLIWAAGRDRTSQKDVDP